MQCSPAKHCCQDLGLILTLTGQSLLLLSHLWHHIDDFVVNVVDLDGGVHDEVEERWVFYYCSILPTFYYCLEKKHFDVAAVVTGDDAVVFPNLYSQAAHPVSCIRRIQRTKYAYLPAYPSKDNFEK